jgi:hypothetical protein
VTDSREQQNATATFTLPVTVAALNVSGLNTTVGPAQQVPLTVSVPNAYSVDLTGTLTLTFASAVGGDDPSIQFSTVGRTVTFTIPNGTTTAVYPQNQQLLVSTGTVAGTITIKATLQAAGSDITPSGLTPITATVPKQVPVITSLTLKQTTGGVVVAITGYAAIQCGIGGESELRYHDGTADCGHQLLVPKRASGGLRRAVYSQHPDRRIGYRKCDRFGHRDGDEHSR